MILALILKSSLVIKFSSTVIRNLSMIDTLTMHISLNTGNMTPEISSIMRVYVFL